MDAEHRSICWEPLWNAKRSGMGLEHLLLSAHSADSVILAFDEDQGPFRFTYRLRWDAQWRLLEAQLEATTEQGVRSLRLQADGQGNWRGSDGQPIEGLAGCIDIDIWPTPFTNSFPLRREPLAIGERRQFLMAWVQAPDLLVRPVPQAYTRLAERLYLFSPIDFIPDILPVIGIADDLVLVPLAIRWLLNRLPPGIADPADKPSA